MGICASHSSATARPDTRTTNPESLQLSHPVSSESVKQSGRSPEELAKLPFANPEGADLHVTITTKDGYQGGGPQNPDQLTSTTSKGKQLDPQGTTSPLIRAGASGDTPAVQTGGPAAPTTVQHDTGKPHVPSSEGQSHQNSLHGDPAIPQTSKAATPTKTSADPDPGKSECCVSSPTPLEEPEKLCQGNDAHAVDLNASPSGTNSKSEEGLETVAATAASSSSTDCITSEGGVGPTPLVASSEGLAAVPGVPMPPEGTKETDPCTNVLHAINRDQGKNTTAEPSSKPGDPAHMSGEPDTVPMGTGSMSTSQRLHRLSRGRTLASQPSIPEEDLSLGEPHTSSPLAAAAVGPSSVPSASSPPPLAPRRDTASDPEPPTALRGPSGVSWDTVGTLQTGEPRPVARVSFDAGSRGGTKPVSGGTILKTGSGLRSGGGTGSSKTASDTPPSQSSAISSARRGSGSIPTISTSSAVPSALAISPIEVSHKEGICTCRSYEPLPRVSAATNWYLAALVANSVGS
eukprot:jgi/Botrbrau1/23164/Bobra.0041s0015.1